MNTPRIRVCAQLTVLAATLVVNARNSLPHSSPRGRPSNNPQPSTQQPAPTAL